MNPDMTGRRNRGKRCCQWTAWLSVGLASLATAQESADPGTTPETAQAAPSSVEATAGPAATEPITSDAARQTYQRLIQEKRYDEAVDIAAQIVAVTSRAHGERSIEVAAPLASLAAAQLRRGDIADAESNYKASIAIIERAEGVGSPRLVEPLTGLADTYLKADLHAQAMETYQLALRANHAAAGFYNLEQFPIMDGLSESYLGLDKLAEANAQQRNQVMIQRRRSGPDSRELLPALYKLARWYNRTGQFTEAQASYQAARRVILESGGDNDPAMVDALVGEAITYQNAGAMPESVASLKRALELLDAQPSRNHLKRAEVLINLGDLYTLGRQPRSARQRYSQAWQELSGEDTLLAERDRYFSRPSRIAGPRLPDFVGTDSERTSAGENIADGYVLASLTVNADGTGGNAVIVESDPPGLLDKQLLRVLRDTSFRPQMKDGETVSSEGVQFRHAFRYLRKPGVAGESAPAAGAEGAGDKGKPITYPGQEINEDSDESRE